MHIITHRLQVPIPTPVHNQRLVTTAEQAAEEFVAPVEAAGVSTQKPLHPSHQVGARGLDHQMKMIRHQAQRMHLPAGFVAGLARRAEEALPILLIPGNRLPPVPAIYRMINRPRIFNSEFACHARQDCPVAGLCVNIKN